MLRPRISAGRATGALLRILEASDPADDRHLREKPSCRVLDERYGASEQFPVSRQVDLNSPVDGFIVHVLHACTSRASEEPHFVRLSGHR